MRKTLFRLCTGISIIGLTILLIACKPPVSDSAPQTPKTPEQMVPPAKPDPKADVAAAKEALSIVGTHSETLDRITKKIVLPTTLGKDVTVTWKSSDETVIKADGTVTRAAVNKKVTLTATLKKGDESATKAFTVTVYGTDQEAADTALARISAPKALVYGATSSVPLDKAVDSINVTWNAEPADIIHTSTGAVTKPSTKTRVTLTASITRGEATASKTYTVTVYPEGATPTAQELLDAATITLPAETTDDIPLQQELDGKLLTWTSSNTASIRIEANTAVVIQDLVPQTVTLTATLTVSGASAEKTFSVTVPAITEITQTWGSGGMNSKKYTFADGIITIKHQEPGKELQQKAYAITVNAEHKIITATLKREFINGEWLTPEQMKQQEMQNTTVGKYEEALGTLADTPVITLQSIRDAFAFAEEGNGLSDEDFFKDIRKDVFSETMTYTQFQQLSDTERTQQIKARIEQHRQEYLADYGLEATATWQEIAQKARNIWIEDINAYFEEIKHPKRYTYKVNKNTGSYLFETHRVYNPEKRWFEQDAEWQTQTPGTPWMYIYGLGNHNRDFTLHINNPSDENRYEAQRKENGTSFTAKKHPSEPEIHGTVTDNNESITVNFGGIDYTLQYRGRELSVY